MRPFLCVERTDGWPAGTKWVLSSSVRADLPSANTGTSHWDRMEQGAGGSGLVGLGLRRVIREVLAGNPRRRGSISRQRRGGATADRDRAAADADRLALASGDRNPVRGRGRRRGDRPPPPRPCRSGRVRRHPRRALRPPGGAGLTLALYGASATGALPAAVGISMRSPGIFDGLPSVGLSISGEQERGSPMSASQARLARRVIRCMGGFGAWRRYGKKPNRLSFHLWVHCNRWGGSAFSGTASAWKGAARNLPRSQLSSWPPASG